MSEENGVINEYFRTFRSRLNTLPLDLKCKLAEVPLQKGMRATSRRDKVIELLDEYKINWVQLGTGTNRYIVKYDGYALKIALDQEGIADNKQEFAICESLMPNVAYAYEISSGGHLLVASYCPAFSTANEMYLHRNAISNILQNWSKRYLLGDVGISSVNFANWGLAPGGRPVCIDYAYIFPVGINVFKCICGNQSMEFATGDFTKYRCTKCKKEYEDRELRAKISPDERARLFKNVNGLEMREAVEEHPVDPKYISYDNNPDSPDPYSVAINVSDHLNGYRTSNWY